MVGIDHRLSTVKNANEIVYGR